MSLQIDQSCRLQVAGCVAFPRPFPSVGRIAIEDIDVIVDDPQRVTQKRRFVVVTSGSGLGQQQIQLLEVPNVKALFFPTHPDDEIDFDDGIWAFTCHGTLKRKKIAKKLRICVKDFRNRQLSSARGMVFACEDVPIINSFELFQSAGTAAEYRMAMPCDCEC